MTVPVYRDNWNIFPPFAVVKEDGNCSFSFIDEEETKGLSAFLKVV